VNVNNILCEALIVSSSIQVRFCNDTAIASSCSDVIQAAYQVDSSVAFICAVILSDSCACLTVSCINAHILLIACVARLANTFHNAIFIVDNAQLLLFIVSLTPLNLDCNLLNVVSQVFNKLFICLFDSVSPL